MLWPRTLKTANFRRILKTNKQNHSKVQALRLHLGLQLNHQVLQLAPTQVHSSQRRQVHQQNQKQREDRPLLEAHRLQELLVVAPRLLHLLRLLHLPEEISTTLMMTRPPNNMHEVGI